MLALRLETVRRDCRQSSARDGHGSAQHDTQYSAGCVTQLFYPWCKAGLKRSGSRDRVDRLPTFNHKDMIALQDDVLLEPGKYSTGHWPEKGILCE